MRGEKAALWHWMHAGSSLMQRQLARSPSCQRGGRTFGLVGLFVADDLGLVEGWETGKSLVEHLIIGFIPQVTHKYTKIIFRPFQKVGINPVKQHR